MTEVIDQLLDLTGDDVALMLQLLDLCRDRRDDDLDRVSAGHREGLLRQCGEDLGRV